MKNTNEIKARLMNINIAVTALLNDIDDDDFDMDFLRDVLLLINQDIAEELLLVTEDD